MKRAPKIINGVFHSPYFIFVRAAGHVSDSHLLNILDLRKFVRTEIVEDWSKPHIYLTDDGEWIHIADDWRYSLWHKGQKQQVENLHDCMPEADIFTCSVGESDCSFHFEYYSGRQLLRRFEVEDKFYDKKRQSVVENIGNPLAPERNLSETGDELTYVLSIAAWAGVKISHNLDLIRCYSIPG